MHPAGGPQYEWGAMLPPPSPKAAPPANKARFTADIIETAADVASLADASRLHQLNVVPPVLVRIPRPLQPDPDTISCPQSPPIPCVGAGLSAGLHAAAARPDNKASHAPCTVQHRTPPSTDAQAPKEARPAPGPARRPPRSRSKPGRRADERGEPLSCSPPQSRHHA